MKFKGYRRPDGTIGIRNHVLILPTSVCASETCRMVISQAPGAVTFNNQNGCGQVKRDLEITRQTIAGLAANPNVYGTIVVGLGCENAQPDKMVELIKEKTNKPIYTVIIQKEGGTLRAISKAVGYARLLLHEAAEMAKSEHHISRLLMGTECGASDPTSGIAANPLVGSVSDRLIRQGASVILCETTEFIGAEHLLVERGASKEVKKSILDIVSRYERHLNNIGENLIDGNPSPGNIASGITTLEEKSLGCIHKGGSSPIVEVVEYAQRPTKRGLIIMDTPGHDVASVTGMAAGGCQLVVFTTGLGSPIGNPVVPVVKVTANDSTYENMKDNIDVDLSPVMKGVKSINEMGVLLEEEILSYLNGRLTKAETYGFMDAAISRLCNYV